jgi:hypothetical protein
LLTDNVLLLDSVLIYLSSFVPYKNMLR